MPLFSSDLQPIVVVVYILVAVMHIVLSLSLRDYGQLLFTLQLLINVMVEDFFTTDSQGKYLTKSVPSDACTVIHRLALQPSYRVFICCPKCSACYPDAGPDSYPELCLSKHLPSQPICSQRKAEHESRLLTGTHGLTHENTHHELDPWIWIYPQWQIPKDLGLTFAEQNTHEYPPWVPLLTSQFKGNIWCKLLKLVMYWPG